MDSATHPSIVPITIGRHTRVYHAFITTAPVVLDGPATMTLYTSTFADVIGFAAEPIPFDTALGRQATRLVLIDSTELTWQRARYRDARCLVVPTDPVLVGLSTLQQWLWQRLKAALSAEACA